MSGIVYGTGSEMTDGQRKEMQAGMDRFAEARKQGYVDGYFGTIEHDRLEHEGHWGVCYREGFRMGKTQRYSSQ